MSFSDDLQSKIDHKTKPLGSLGLLENLAFKIGNIQQSLSPSLKNPHLLVFAADHGIAKEGISAYPPEVTHQMVLNFLNGGAAINVFCKQHGFDLKIIDAGVNFDFEENPSLIIAKATNGTANMLLEPAMTKAQLDFSLQHSAKLVNDIAKKDCNVIGFGEMGIGNTSSASLIISTLLNLPIEDCIGRGTGVSDEQLLKKIEILKRVVENRNVNRENPLDVLQELGGFEVVQMCGAMLEAYKNNMIILVDGFIATAAFLVAYFVDQSILNNAVFCHQSDEQAHRKVLEFFKVKPILQLDLRLGEGTGCALAYPILQSAVHFLNEMASFAEANVSNKDE